MRKLGGFVAGSVEYDVSVDIRKAEERYIEC